MVHEEIVSVLPFSINNIEYKTSRINLTWIEHCDIANTLLCELDKCKTGYNDSAMFEDLCYRVLKYVFSDVLALWEKQKKSNANLYRFDLLCRIKDNTEKTL